MIHRHGFWDRPLACVLGFHKFRNHPGGISWLVCYRCWGEKEMK